MRKAVPILCLLALVGGLLAAPAASAATSTLVVVATVGSNIASVAGTPVTLDQPPVLVNGRTLVPFRFFGQALGANVHWVAEAQGVVAVFGTTAVHLWVDNQTASINGQATPLDVPPCILGGRVMVPLRFLASAFGWEVTWDAALRAATVKRASLELARPIKVGDTELAFLPTWGDTHWFEFEAEAGTVYAINTCDEGVVVAEIVVCDSVGNVVAERCNGEIDFGPYTSWLGSPEILFAPETDGTYRVKLWQPQPEPGYGPSTPPESWPVGVQVAIPQPLTLGESYPLEFASWYYVHSWFTFQATAGKTYLVECGGASSAYVYGPDFKYVGEDFISFTAAVSGQHYVAVFWLGNQAPYPGAVEVTQED